MATTPYTPLNPLLEREGAATLFSSVANLSNTILGTGMLAMPHAFTSSGIILGTFTVLLCGATAALGLYFLSRAAHLAPRREASFTVLAELTFPKLARVFDTAIFLKCYGVSISYLIIIGQLMPRVIHSFSDNPTPVLEDRRLWILLAMTLLCPLGFLKRLDSFKFTSYIALCAVINLIFIVIYKYFDQSGIPPRGEVHLIRFSPSYISSFPVQIFAFTCAQNLFSVFNELFQNTQKRLNTVIGTSIGSAAAIYILLGLLGYLTFGDKVGSNIIEMYPHSVMVNICQFGIVIMVLFSYPLQLHPARHSLHSVLFLNTGNQTPEEAQEQQHLLETQNASQINEPVSSSTAFILETSFILVTTFLVSMLVSSLDVVLSFVGSTGSVTISFILPSVFYISLFPEPKTTKEKCLRGSAYFLCVWGIFVMIVSLSLNIYHVVAA